MIPVEIARRALVARHVAAGVERPALADPAGLPVFALAAWSIAGRARIVQRQVGCQPARPGRHGHRVIVAGRAGEGADVPALQRRDEGRRGRGAIAELEGRFSRRRGDLGRAGACIDAGRQRQPASLAGQAVGAGVGVGGIVEEQGEEGGRQTTDVELLRAELHRDRDRRREPREWLASGVDRIEEEGLQATAETGPVRRHRPPRCARRGSGQQADGQRLGGGIGREGDADPAIGAAQRGGRAGGKAGRRGRRRRRGCGTAYCHGRLHQRPARHPHRLIEPAGHGLRVQHQGVPDGALGQTQRRRHHGLLLAGQRAQLPAPGARSDGVQRDHAIWNRQLQGQIVRRVGRTIVQRQRHRRIHPDRERVGRNLQIQRQGGQDLLTRRDCRDRLRCGLCLATPRQRTIGGRQQRRLQPRVRVLCAHRGRNQAERDDQRNEQHQRQAYVPTTHSATHPYDSFPEHNAA
ncbi:MAG: hypothetical protein MI924_26460 [Chloroflexales bacterium]|nr:hypothetical protein [Chloroflexales bacterium]